MASTHSTMEFRAKRLPQFSILGVVALGRRGRLRPGAKHRVATSEAEARSTRFRLAVLAGRRHGVRGPRASDAEGGRSVSRTRTRATLIVVAALAALLLERSPAFAGSFTLFEGKQYELCREYAKNLAAFPDLSDKTYEWPLDPKLKDFTKPRWEAVDIQQHMDVVKTLYTWSYRGYEGHSDPEQIWQIRSPEVLDDIARHAARLEMAKIDFNHTGSTDIVYRYYHELPNRDKANSPGNQKRGYWYIYISSLDPKLSNQFRTDSFFDRFYDSFLFRGRFYLIDLGTFGPDMATTLTIYEPKANVNRLEAYLLPVCHLRYRE